VKCSGKMELKLIFHGGLNASNQNRICILPLLL
jgi:hypothetical protein